jgi:hypothetical protein
MIFFFEVFIVILVKLLTLLGTSVWGTLLSHTRIIIAFFGCRIHMYKVLPSNWFLQRIRHIIMVPNLLFFTIGYNIIRAKELLFCRTIESPFFGIRVIIIISSKRGIRLIVVFSLCLVSVGWTFGLYRIFVWFLVVVVP